VSSRVILVRPTGFTSRVKIEFMRIALEDLFKNIVLFIINRKYRSFVIVSFRLGLKKRGEEVNFRFLGKKIRIPDTTSFIWQYYEIFFKEYYKFQKTSKQPVIFDCGANLGLSTIYFKRANPNAIIHAYEPDPRVYDVLSSNVTAFDFEGVTMHHSAVWNKNETLSFESSGADSGRLGDSGNNTIQVEAIDLKEHLQNYPKVDFMKIDIEGAEYTLLRHLQDDLKRISSLFIECHTFIDQEQGIGEILDILSKNGFRYFIHNESNRRSPIVNRKEVDGMDMQLNIFAYQ
jgi:FkbM family methyltransferase